MINIKECCEFVEEGLLQLESEKNEILNLIENNKKDFSTLYNSNTTFYQLSLVTRKIEQIQKNYLISMTNKETIETIKNKIENFNMKLSELVNEIAEKKLDKFRFDDFKKMWRIEMEYGFKFMYVHERNKLREEEEERALAQEDYPEYTCSVCEDKGCVYCCPSMFI